MIVIKKSILATLTISLISFQGIAQEKGDIGVLFSSNNRTKLAIEYRKAVAEKWQFKLGTTYGNSGWDWFNYSSEVVGVTDSSITERYRSTNSLYGGLRIGTERQFGQSMFSLGGDLNLNYRHTDYTYRNQTKVLGEDGSWGYAPTTFFNPLNDPSASHITRHFLETGFRLSCNLNIPISPSFLLSLTAASTFVAPIYMGASNIRDPYDEFIGTPPSTVNFYTSLGIGLRYNIGGLKKEKATQAGE